MKFHQIGLVLAVSVCGCAALKPAVKWAAETCQKVALEQDDLDLYVACVSAEKVSDLMAKRRLQRATFVADGGVDGGVSDGGCDQ